MSGDPASHDPSRPAPITVEPGRRANIDVHHGALRPAVGVHCFQVFRANRGAPGPHEPKPGWTYNHAPMLAHWKGRFWLQYLSNPLYEHVAPGCTLLTSSSDGREWESPRVLFPEYPLAAEDRQRLADVGPVPECALMHQRMGFHVAPNGRLLTLAFYGFSPTPHDLPFDKRGIGRVVREIRSDGSWGPIHFIRYNRHAGWNETNTRFPFYRASDDAGFVEACESVLADSLVCQQWKEEHGDADELVRLKGNYKAFCWYTLPDGRVVGLWKWSLAGMTSDRGRTWDWVGETPEIETAGSKVWGQRTSDGRYALVYNPTTNNKLRWPLAVVTSDDGLHFSELLAVAGEVSPRRYTGCEFKNFGLNYVRGISEGNGVPPDGALWVAYSMNKEDIWVARVPVPIRGRVSEPVDDRFEMFAPGGFVPGWNLCCPQWAPVDIAEPAGAGCRVLRIRDGDPHDHAVAERVFPPAKEAIVAFRIQVPRVPAKPLFVELWDSFGQVPVRVIFDGDGMLKSPHGRKVEKLGKFAVGKWIDLSIRVLGSRHRYELSIDGELTGRSQRYQGEASRDAGWYFRASVDSVERLVFRTGPMRREPNADTVAVGGPDLPELPRLSEPAEFWIASVRAGALPAVELGPPTLESDGRVVS